MNGGGSCNIYFSLRQKEYSVKCLYRHNLKLLRRLVCQGDEKFCKTYEKQSTHRIAYESGRLFFDDFQTSFSLRAGNVLPAIYKMSSVPKSEKIEICLVSECAVNKTLPESHSYRASIIAITASNWLHRYDLDTGRLLEKVYLSSKYKFKYLDWDTEEETFVIASTQKKLCALGRSAGIAAPALMAVALFQVWPLQFVAMMEITAELFGQGITNVTLSNGCLLVMFKDGILHLYSMQHILSQGKSANSDDHKVTFGNGSFPMGLPVNIVLKERPPLLFEVKSDDFFLSIGGIPWHYIITPFNTLSNFEIYSVGAHQLLEGGRLFSMAGMRMMPDKCMFHPDESGNVMHIGANEVRIFQLKSSEDKCSSGVVNGKIQQKCKLELKYKIAADKEPGCEMPKNEVTYTSSGRAVKRVRGLNDVDCSYESIQSVIYEDELDLLVVTSISEREEQEGFAAKVSLHDNQSGELLRTVELEEPWEMNSEHAVTLDRDTLIHITQGSQRRNCVYVYRLDRNLPDEEEMSPKKKRPQNRRSSRRSIPC